MRTGMMVAGIVVGIAVLTIVIAIGEGAQRRVSSSLERVGLGEVIIVMSTNRGGMPGSEQMQSGGQSMQSSGQSMQSGAQSMQSGGQEASVSQERSLESSRQGSESTLTAGDVDALRQISGVNLVSPFFRERDLEVSYASQSHVTELYGVEPGWEWLNNWVVAQGSFFTEQELDAANRVVILGQTAVDYLFPPGEDPVGASIRIQNANFEVIGVFEAKGTGSSGKDTDDLVVIPATTFSERLIRRANYDQILVQPAKADSIKMVAGDVQAVLQQEHGIAPQAEDDFSLRIPTEMMQMRQGLSDTMKIFLWIAALISMGIGGIVIMNIMLVSVGERTREIGLRKALGARQQDIRNQFLFEALAVSLLGGFLGVFAGLGGASLVQVFAGMPTVVSWNVILAGALFSTSVGVIFGLQPAKKAALLDPVEALRSE